ncbi:CoxS Aerobic-type carbon monoxide dehydrogenase, small subunit CoxS/CutS homologs [Rhabdaerophilaceae bacterium]
MIAFKLNEKDMKVDAPAGSPLLFVLANDLGINGVKYGCGRSQCGSCTVLVDGEPVRSCQTPISAVAGRSVTTLEGLTDGGKPSKLQQAFIDEQAAQCGFCTAGMIMQAQALLDRNPKPGDAEIRTALNGNLCRCGSHNRVVRAVLRAAKEA